MTSSIIFLLMAVPWIAYQSIASGTTTQPAAVMASVKLYSDFMTNFSDYISIGIDNISSIETMENEFQFGVPIFEGIRFAMQFISPLLLRGDQGEIDRVKERFGEMRKHFYELHNKIKALERHQYFAQITREYFASHLELLTLKEYLVNVPNGSLSNATFGFYAFRIACEERLMGLERMVKVMTTTTLLNSAFDNVKYDMREFDEWLEVIMINAIDSGVIYHACLNALFGEREGNEQDKIEYTKNKIKSIWKAILEAVYKLRMEFYKQVPHDAEECAKENIGMAHDTFSKQLHKFFHWKYYWVPHWLVLSYDQAQGHDHYSSCGNCATVGQHGRNVFTGWCNMSAPNAFNDLNTTEYDHRKGISYSNLKQIALGWLGTYNYSTTINDIVPIPFQILGRCGEASVVGGNSPMYVWADAKKAGEFIQQRAPHIHASTRGISIITHSVHYGYVYDPVDCFMMSNSFCYHNWMMGFPVNASFTVFFVF